jgi:hypothetical protein
MKKPFTFLLISTLVVAVLPAIATAQKSYALALGGGAAIPVGNLTNTQKTGYNGLIAFAIGAGDLPFGVRIDGIYNNLSHVKNSVAGAPVTSDLRVRAAIGNLIFAFPGTSAKAYMLAGIGSYSSKADTAGARADRSWGFNGGLGATFGFGPFAMFLESRYHTISRNESKGGVYQFVPITLGVMF